MKAIRRLSLVLVVALIAACMSAPDSSTGVTGIVTWNAAPLTGVTVKIMAGSGRFTDAALAETMTDPTGKFLLTGVAPGKYTVYAFGPSEEFIAWMGMTVDVPASGNAAVSPFQFAKKMTILTPISGDTTVGTRPSLSWNSFPGAEFYHVDLFLDTEPYTVILRKDVGLSTSFVVPDDLIPGQAYQWGIYAVTKAGGNIADSSGNHFAVSKK